MKQDIHPDYTITRIVCACGRVTETRGTMDEYHVEICSHCHPFFTGKQKLVDTAGRVERFLSKYGDSEEEAEKVAAEAAERAEESEKIIPVEEEEEDLAEGPEDAAGVGEGDEAEESAAPEESEAPRPGQE